MDDVSQAVIRLERQIAEIGPLRSLKRASPEFAKWCRDTEVAIEKTFGPGTRHLKDFSGIRYGLSSYSSGTPDSARQSAYLEGLNSASLILQSFIEELREYGIGEDFKRPKGSSIDVIEIRLRRFHLVARQLRSRHSDRATLEITDEYDVQDLLHALLCVDFDDIRHEEWTPSYAGGSARMDFLLKDEQVVIEVKKTRKNLPAKEIGEQLIVDIEKYRTHPSCRMLFCLVYDPEGYIGNPASLERDLSREREGITVKVLVVPKGT